MHSLKSRSGLKRSIPILSHCSGDTLGVEELNRSVLLVVSWMEATAAAGATECSSCNDNLH